MSTPTHSSAHASYAPMRIAIVTDAWLPQMNGVVRTLKTTCEILREAGHDVMVISPDQFPSLPCPSYPEIRLALPLPGVLSRKLRGFSPDAIHIATEGPLGFAARNYCVAATLPFTTAFHTQFPDYLAKRTGLSPDLFWRYIRWFHRPAQRIMVATESIREELRAHELTQLHHWSRGVDLGCFTPDAPVPADYVSLKGPIQLYAGRVAVEKNIEAFLELDTPGTKIVVGDGPALQDLKHRFSDAVFVGRKSGRELAGYYAGADVFVFPSKTDTFGLVVIEALACGTPVAAYPVAGPRDILRSESGAIDNRLDRAIAVALSKDRSDCARYGRTYNWRAATDQFLRGLVLAESDAAPRLPQHGLAA